MFGPWWELPFLDVVLRQVVKHQSVWFCSIMTELEAEGSRAERVESLEGVEAVEVLVTVATLLALRVHGVLALVKLTSHFCRKKIKIPKREK